ncbi:MAG: ABC transporter permease, partial [Turicibacter sp.]|nr:ABC transporter permease [Turicibacter sp.]
QILVPESFTETNEYFEISRYEWFITTEESARIAAYGDEILLDFVGDELGFMVHDFDAAEAMDRGMIQLISTLTYAFVGVLILIGLTNVISTISENIKTRSNEFAMLQSAGMTSKGIRRMLNLESIFSSVRSLMFGVPLGIFGTVMTHRNINSTAGFSYTLPWIPIIISVVAVFLTTWVTMQHAARKLRNQNIIETIRSGSGM